MKSIIIPTYNHLEDFLKPCCESIIEYTDLIDIEIIIVANGCTDGTIEYVQSLPEQFKLVISAEALGYTKATNLGVKESKGDIIILMNNDVVLLPQPKNQWIDYLCKPLKDNIGLTCNLKIWDESVERMFGVFFLVATPRFLWDRIGGLDESWTPGGGEDIEYCLKLEQLGYKIIQVPDEVNTIINGINVNNFMSYHKGEGTMLDDEHREGWMKHIVEVRARLKEKYRLPEGWFYGEDINEYRQLVEDVPEGGTIIELGCYKGRSLCSVADIIKRKHLTVYVVDIFTGTDSELKESNYRHIFEDNIKRFGIFDKVTIYEGYTQQAALDPYFPGNDFDLVFIDADHSYEAVKGDLELWIPRVKKGGKIAGHDFGNKEGVGRALNEIFDCYKCNQIHFEIHSGVATTSVWSKRL